MLYVVINNSDQGHLDRMHEIRRTRLTAPEPNTYYMTQTINGDDYVLHPAALPPGQPVRLNISECFLRVS